MPSEPLIGYLTLIEKPSEDCFYEAYISVDERGYPLDYGYTDKIQVSSIQRHLCGETLRHFISNEVCGTKLIDEVEFKPTIILVNNHYLLERARGYLRRKIHDLTNDEKFNLVVFPRRICDHFVRGLFKGDIIRIYYYDCQYDKDDPNFKDENNPNYNERIEKYDAYKGKFDGFRSIRDVEVKLGQLVVSSKEDKQKGADVLIAIDLITKAYENQYDIAILFAGDRDFLRARHML